jgi:hypothetical protein
VLGVLVPVTLVRLKVELEVGTRIEVESLGGSEVEGL